jgi:hypothetical protein
MGEAIRRPASIPDEELLALFAGFGDVEAALSKAVSQGNCQQDNGSHALHQKWVQLCRLAASQRAVTPKGMRAKAAMLLTVLMVLAPPTQERDLHEMLAESVARDLLEPHWQ